MTRSLFIAIHIRHPASVDAGHWGGNLTLRRTSRLFPTVRFTGHSGRYTGMPRSEDDYICEILRTEKVLRAVLHRFAPQPADLEDLLQETYTHLFSLSPDRRRGIRNVEAFVVATARNVATDWIRHRQVVSIETVEDMSTLPIASDAAGLEEIVHTHQQLLSIASGIAKLPERCRGVFTMRRVYGLTQKEIAAKLQISEGQSSSFSCEACAGARPR